MVSSFSFPVTSSSEINSRTILNGRRRWRNTQRISSCILGVISGEHSFSEWWTIPRWSSGRWQLQDTLSDVARQQYQGCNHSHDECRTPASCQGPESWSMRDISRIACPSVYRRYQTRASDDPCTEYWPWSIHAHSSWFESSVYPVYSDNIQAPRTPCRHTSTGGVVSQHE